MPDDSRENENTPSPEPAKREEGERLLVCLAHGRHGQLPPQHAVLWQLQRTKPRLAGLRAFGLLHFADPKGLAFVGLEQAHGHGGRQPGKDRPLGCALPRFAHVSPKRMEVNTQKTGIGRDGRHGCYWVALRIRGSKLRSV